MLPKFGSSSLSAVVIAWQVIAWNIVSNVYNKQFQILSFILHEHATIILHNNVPYFWHDDSSP